MKYALNLAEDRRILSATYPQYAPDTVAIVDNLPGGNISDYRYVNGEFVFEPLPQPEPDNTPTSEERLEALEAAMLEMMMGGTGI